MPTKTEAIAAFLQASTHKDLSRMYTHNMEVQVNVARDGGDRVDGEFKGRCWHAYTDNIQQWKSFRIPWNANTVPEYKDSELKYNLEEHAEGIGMTGWDWKNKVSRWIGFDFDAILGHQKGLSHKELEDIKTTASDIEWVTLRKSTSGKGLHLYVFLDPPIETKNHTEHAALARAILGMLSALTGFDFHAKVDTCGSNLWIWHRKMKNDPEGLKLISTGLPLNKTPEGWRDHISVIKGTNKRTIPQFAQKIPEVKELFEELCGQRSTIPLDTEHRKLMTYLNEVEALWWWDQDRNMLVCHTADLKKVHEELNLKGIFQTIASGKEHGQDQNSFAHPCRNGGWIVRRHTPGCAEAPTWQQDGAGWTKCYLNVDPDINSASAATGGIEHPTSGFIFTQAESAQKTALQLGADVDIPNWTLLREAKIKQHKDGRLILEIKHAQGDPPDQMQGWIAEKGWWKRIFSIKRVRQQEVEIGNYDDLIRHLVTETGDDYGWTIKSEGQWRNEPLVHVRSALDSLGFKQLEVKTIIGSSVFKCWTLVNKPFENEYPGDRSWNRNAAQLRFSPSDFNSNNLKYPNWLKVLTHCGKSLDHKLSEHPWAVANAVKTGADYLKCWIASIFQEPDQPLPYLFLYSKDQNTGKSILHEAIDLLITKGCMRADNALTSQGGFNAELENAVLCVVEETDLRKSNLAYNRIKDWVTSRHLPIHRKQRTPYNIINTSHWIQAANDFRYCPIFQGDTRITMLNVQPLDPIELIPKRELLILLEKEAPDFLSAILNLELPPSNDRLNVPVIETDDKVHAGDSNRDMLQMFVDETIKYCEGHTIKFSEFFEKFVEWLDPDEVHQWSKIKVGRDLTPTILRGRLKENNQLHLGNVSWENKKADGRYTLMGGKLWKKI